MSISYKQITVKDLKPVNGLPLQFDIEDSGVNAVTWVEEHQQSLRNILEANGALLIRGLKIFSSAQFGKILPALFGAELLGYTYRSTPRTELRGNVYTATEYPATEVIPQHNENSYARHWPNRIGFLCLLASSSGGETPIGDSRVIYKLLPKLVRDKFEAQGIMYVRNYSMLDLPWSEVFQTSDKTEVEAFCKANDLICEWGEDNRLRTSQINQAITIHPLTGEKLWFNQAHLFHPSNLSKGVAETMISSLGEENLPRNAYYGDGSAIELDVLEMIRSTYEQTKIKFPWKTNDLLLLDNMLYTHGREAFSGPRKVLVGMACPNS